MAMRWLVVLAIVIPALSGCLQSDQTAATDGVDGLVEGAVALEFKPYDIHERFDLSESAVDQKWTVRVGPEAKVARLYMAFEEQVQGAGEHNRGYCYSVKHTIVRESGGVTNGGVSQCMMASGNVAVSVQLNGLPGNRVLADQELAHGDGIVESRYTITIDAQQSPLTDFVLDVDVDY